MYRIMMWCYIIILTLLDISLNSKLTAQGKSHGTGYSVHDTLAEGVNFQEWGKEAGGGEGEEGEEAALRLSPPALSFGARPLGAAHVHTVTLVNVANVTLHLASVAGTTPDFHASFFDTKTLAPQSNTSFNVVYLGRREGLVSALLFIHTSRGVHKYPVSALGVASEWDVWPLLGVRVPANASLEPLLTLRNPTARAVQVTEVYSSGGWVKLVLPEGVGGAEGACTDEGGGGGCAPPAAAWLLPPRAARPLVRLRLEPPAHAHHATAYVRIKTNASSSGLVVAVEARAAAAGEYAAPLHVRLAARGHRDPPGTWEISVGNSAATGARLEAGVTGARCEPHPAAPPPPPPHPAPHPAPPDDAHEHAHTHHNGVKSSGASVSVLRPNIEPYQELTTAAQLTLDYEKLWAEFSGSGEGAGAEGGAFCSGTLSVGRAAVPYSLRLLPGTLLLTPDALDLISSDTEGGTKQMELVAENAFAVPIRLVHLEYPDSADHFVQISGFTDQVLQPRARAVVARLRLKEDVGVMATLDVKLVLHTNISMYTVPLRVYSGKLELEWEWPVREAGQLSLGALGTSSTRRVACWVRSPAPAPLCVRALATDLPGAQLALAACAHLHPVPPDHRCRCIPAGGRTRAVLTLVAPARAGALRGTVTVSTAHARTEGTVSLTALTGKVAALPVHLDGAAPYAWAMTPVIIDNTMSLRMRVLGWSDGAGAGTDSGGEAEAGAGADLALTYHAPPAAEVAPGRSEVGVLTYMPEKLCEPACYTGLDPNTEEGMAWVANGEAWSESPAGVRGEAAIESALRADRALLAARRALYQPRSTNISLHVRTTQVVLIPVRGWVRLGWPRLAGAGVAGGAGGADAGLAAVGSAARLRLRARNPSRSHSLLLQPVLGPPTHPTPDIWEGAECPVCARAACGYALAAFRLAEWRAVRGGAREWAHDHHHKHDQTRSSSNSSVSLPTLVLSPSAEIELSISFAPRDPGPVTAYLYLRNNLTITEGVQLAGRGAFPSFEIGGRRPGGSAPLVFEVTECGQAGVVKRVLAARNTGAVGVRLRDWRVGGGGGGGAPCSNRGFSLSPCAPLTLLPNQSAPLTLTFTPDFTLARVHAALELRTERARLAFPLAAVTAPRLLARCARAAPRPPFEPGLRAGGALLALALLALVLAAAALDAERLLRRARAARAAAPPRAPLDLRAVAAAPAPAPPVAPPRAPPPRRRKVRKMDPAAESRAFERWRASLRRPDDTDSRSSEELEPEPRPPSPAPPAAPPPAPPPPYEPLLQSEGRAPPSSAEDEPQSSESECSSPLELEADDEDPPTKADKPRADRADRADAGPREGGGRRAHAAGASPPDSHSRARRRDAETRRSERRAEAEGARGVGSALRPSTTAGGVATKHHARKDKPRARRERAAPTPPRSDPPPTEPRAGSASSSNGAAVRWGASWSSVVARSSATPPAPAAPPAPAPAHPLPAPHAPPHPARSTSPPPTLRPAATDSNSLFYFNGEGGARAPPPPASRPARPAPEYAWRAAPPPAPADTPFSPPPRDFLGEESSERGASYGSIGPSGLWGGGGGGGGAGVGAGGAGAEARAWPWAGGGGYGPAPGSGPVRPPPGFGGAAAGAGVGAPGPVGSRAVRPFDPFQSLAAIWSRTALDWRDPDDRDRAHDN